MTRIFKFDCAAHGNATVSMPKGATILSVQNQDEELKVWAVVDDTVSYEDRKFFVALTGQSLRGRQSDWKFLGTVQFMRGKYIVHVFEVF